ncbi:trigger factor [Roseivirga pacifica]|uniref:Trigger factor n=1 Tax=Roseivirga pacifica TaxID=1267423 RepID=A0A1I0M3I9_9BACT|nr:trigger factor [Roseivirga pacifica]MCO6358575.1 trigger factor [Roseivirga pacifica]MCO6365789.1 trigger factor [Roseivirga pacifica]MCO6371481.1 trigger factor [Roseivirga pacifica]MCO6376408.1 trigger factor [Roseivirga pacifica]MCO6378859.1 trigger factor [Roseivirga pacifica]
MDITLDKKDSNVASIKIKLNEADYQSKVDEKIKDYSKKAQIKGFRPGKVPTGVIKKMYGKSILVEEINHLVGHKLQDYIRDNELKILGEPIPDQQSFENIDWENAKEFEFDYNIGLVDDFKVDLSKKVKVTNYNIEADQKVLDETLDNVRTQFGEMTNPEVSEEGDIIFGAFKQGDFTHDTTVDLNDLNKTNAKKFIGKKKGDEIKVDLSKLYKEASKQAAQLGKTEDELEGLDMNFVFEVKNVNRRVLAEVNQALFDKTFGEGVVSSEEEFMAKITDTIGENYARETNAWLNKTIQDELIKNTEISLPDEFLKEWLKLSGEGKVTDADIEKEYDIYADQLRWNLISNEIAKENEIKPEHEDIKEATRKMIEAQFMGSGMGQFVDQMDAFVDNYLQGENGQNYMKMAEQVQVEKVLEFVKEKIEIKSKKVSLDKFKEIVEN